MLQKSDLARMYRLFNRVDKGLVPVADTFKKHVEAQGNALVKEVTDAMEAKKAKDAGTAPYLLLRWPDFLQLIQQDIG